MFRAATRSCRTRKTMEIKLAGLEALVPEEIEKHLILNPNRLRTLRGCALGSRDVRGGEVRFENS